MALAQNCCNLRAITKALKAGGQWKGAWEFTYLNALDQSTCATSADEDAAVVELNGFLRKSFYANFTAKIVYVKTFM